MYANTIIIGDQTIDLGNRGELEELIAVERARIDSLASLPTGATVGDAELQDIRVKADGTTATSAGRAVREQISEINNEIDALNDAMSNKQNKLIAGSNITIAADGRTISANVTSSDGAVAYDDTAIKARVQALENSIGGSASSPKTWFMLSTTGDLYNYDIETSSTGTQVNGATIKNAFMNGAVGIFRSYDDAETMMNVTCIIAGYDSYGYSYTELYYEDTGSTTYHRIYEL